MGAIEMAQGRSWAAAKFFFTMALVMAISVWPRTLAYWLAVPGAVVAVLILASGVPLWQGGVQKGIIKRVLMLEPFVIGVALLALFAPGGGWAFFGFLMARCTIALATTVWFTSTTGFSEMLRVARRLHVPGLLVTTLALMHRYVFVLTEEAGRMRRARESRTFGQSRRRMWRAMSSVVGQLFLRASERADRIYAAMCARGWRP